MLFFKKYWFKPVFGYLLRFFPIAYLIRYNPNLKYLFKNSIKLNSINLKTYKGLNYWSSEVTWSLKSLLKLWTDFHINSIVRNSKNPTKWLEKQFFFFPSSFKKGETLLPNLWLSSTRTKGVITNKCSWNTGVWTATCSSLKILKG